MFQALINRKATRSPVGLDLGSEGARAAQVVRRGDTWSVTTLASWRVPRGSPGLDADSAARERLAHWLRGLQIGGRKTVAGLSPPDVEIHAMELPRPSGGSPEEQRRAAQFELARLAGFSDDGAESDFWWLPESRSMTTTALGVAAEKSCVAQSLDLCRRARLDCVQLDATPCALARFGYLIRGPAATHDDVWSVLDLGARMSRLILCVGEIPVLARAFDYGGRLWTRKLAESLSVSEETAERHKRDHGIARIARSAPEAPPATHLLGEMIYNVLRADIDAIIGEVERSYRYVLQCFRQRRPGPLILAGGGASMFNLDALLAERLGIEVIVPACENSEALAALHVDAVAGQTREPLTVFACAIGLAIAARHAQPANCGGGRS